MKETEREEGEPGQGKGSGVNLIELAYVHT